MKNELCAIGQVGLRGTRIVIPKSLRTRILKLGHKGHPGIDVLKKNLRSKVWWPGIDKDVERKCRTCYGYQLVSIPAKPEPMHRTQFPSASWEHIAAALFGPLSSGDSLLPLIMVFNLTVMYF